VYYRREFYPRAGQADVPDDLWAEFQRIRGHLSNLDQNNVDAKTLKMETIVLPTDADHNGVSDIVGENGKFLYKDNASGSLAQKNLARGSDRWVDLGKYGLTLRCQSKGDAPWIVGVSIDSHVYRNSDSSDVTGMTVPLVTDPVTMLMVPPTHPSDRANVRLRVKSSQDGLSIAEAVGGFNKYVLGSSIATVSTVLSRGGPIEFSPAIHYRVLFKADSTPTWGFRVVKANIFAFALYR
jgi:hypothetical protein